MAKEEAKNCFYLFSNGWERVCTRSGTYFTARVYYYEKISSMNGYTQF